MTLISILHRTHFRYISGCRFCTTRKKNMKKIKIVLTWSVRNAASAENLVHRWTDSFVHLSINLRFILRQHALINNNNNKNYKSHPSALKYLIFNENIDLLEANGKWFHCSWLLRKDFPFNFCILFPINTHLILQTLSS